MFWARYVPSVHFKAFSILEKKLIVFADDYLMAVVPSPGIRVTAAESMIRDHGRVSEWFDFGE